MGAGRAWTSSGIGVGFCCGGWTPPISDPQSESFRVLSILKDFHTDEASLRSYDSGFSSERLRPASPVSAALPWNGSQDRSTSKKDRPVGDSSLGSSGRALLRFIIGSPRAACSASNSSWKGLPGSSYIVCRILTIFRLPGNFMNPCSTSLAESGHVERPEGCQGSVNMVILQQIFWSQRVRLEMEHYKVRKCKSVF